MNWCPIPFQIVSMLFPFPSLITCFSPHITVSLLHCGAGAGQAKLLHSSHLLNYVMMHLPLLIPLIPSSLLPPLTSEGRRWQGMTGAKLSQINVWSELALKIHFQVVWGQWAVRQCQGRVVMAMLYWGRWMQSSRAVFLFNTYIPLENNISGCLAFTGSSRLVFGKYRPKHAYRQKCMWKLIWEEKPTTSGTTGNNKAVGLELNRSR